MPRKAADRPAGRRLDLTAAVCTRGRPELLGRAVTSLVRQGSSLAEVLVIDNAPDSDTVARLLSDGFPSVRRIVEPVMGLNFARNRALRSASTSIVAFLDDDAEASPGWAAEFCDVFQRDPEVGLCTGRVTALSLETEGQRLFEANGGYDRGPERICLPDDRTRRLHGLRAPLIAWAVSVGNGTSCAIDRQIALRLGGFDEALDLGPVLPGGGDHDMLWRVLEAGYKVIYEPRARARHEHRRSVRDACNQIAAQQRGFVAMLTKTLGSSRGSRRFSALAFLAWRLIRPGVRLLRRAVGRDPLPARALLAVWGHCWAGLWAYRAGRRTAERRRVMS